VRRHVASTSRSNVRTASGGTGSAGGSSPGGAGIAGSGDGPPRSRQRANRSTTASSSGTAGASGTSPSPAARISSRWSGEATAFLVGAHQHTTCDWARVIAT
jgi:hypothetical protein